MKRLFSIEQIVYYGNSEVITEFHSAMFHGVAERPGAQSVEEKCGDAGHGISCRLSIMRPGNEIPAVSMPQSNLIVDAGIAAALGRLAHIELLPVDFVKLFEMNYTKGDMWWYQDKGSPPRDPNRFVREVEDESEKFEPVPKYFEVLSYNYYDISERFDGTTRFHVDVVEDNHKSDAVFEASDEMIAEHPILWRKFIVVPEEVFAILEPHIDRDYFSVTEAKPLEE